MKNANSFLFSGDQCLMVDGNKVTIRGFEGFICLELPPAGSEDQVYLTVSDSNDVCTATDPSDPSAAVSLEQFL